MESFDEMVNLLNSCPDKDSLNDSLSEYLSHKKNPETFNQNLKLTNQIIYFLNGLIPVITNDDEKNNKSAKKLDINEIDRDSTLAGDVELIHNEPTLVEYPDKYLITY